ncbi:MAG TPA: deoxynucleoside kinase [Candidatus Edwardsbacteria bacterium]|nr:deoxynucleoside kinase [Candidatus Edwardsbacteria bacterium]
MKQLIPTYIAIEGVIGVGKTSLTRMLAERFHATTVLEEVEANPFLSSFYGDRRAYAFQTQLFFLLSRFRQQQSMAQRDLFGQTMVADYLFAKDRIFAYLNLDSNELALYEALWKLLEQKTARPDLVIYLQADLDTLQRRIKERGRSFEHNLSRDYLAELSEAYNHFFFHYTDTPLLVVNVAGIDFVKRERDFDDLVAKICEPHPGTRYYVPMGSK